MITIDIYTTPTCMPCKILKKRLEKMVGDTLKLNALNATDYPELGIMATPHIIAKKDDNVFFEGHLAAPKFNSFISQIKEMM